MKLCTRKFLAGLLSFGMLLQAASPLSALAAETAPQAATHELKVTISNVTYTLTADENNNVKSDGWLKDYPSVSYDDGFVFDGYFPNNVTINGQENVTIKGYRYAVYGDLTANVKNLTVTKDGHSTTAAITGAATITCSKDVKISGYLDYSDPSEVNQSVGKMLTVNSADNVTIDGMIAGGADINCNRLFLNCKNGSTVRGTLIVRNAEKIQATAYAIYGVIGDSGYTGRLVLNNCTGTVKLINTHTSHTYGPVKGGSVTITPKNDKVTYYAGTTGEDSKVPADAKDCSNSKYLYFEINLDGQVQPTMRTLTLTNAEAYDGETKLNGTTEGNTTTYKVEDGKKLAIKAVAPGTPAEKYRFTSWTGSNETGKEFKFVVNENTTLTANWTEMHQIYIDNELYNDGAYYYPGEKVQIVSDRPIDGDIQYSFVAWEKVKGSADFDYAAGGAATNYMTNIIMPDGNVKLKANWTESYKVTLGEGCSLVDSKSSFYPADADVTIKVASVNARMIQKVTGITVKPKSSDSFSVTEANADGYYTFKMPGEPVTVNAETGNFCTVTVDGGEPTEYAVGDTVYLNADTSDTNKKFVRWNWNGKVAEFGNYRQPSASFHAVDDVKLSSVYAYLVAVDNNCALGDADHDEFYEENENVTVKANVDLADSELTGITVKAVDGYDHDGEEFKATEDMVEKGKYTFTMPACPVTVNASYNNVYTIIVDGEPQNCTAGKEFTLKADTNDADKKFIEWNIDDGEITDDSFDKEDPNASFTPTENVTLAAVYAYRVTVENGKLDGQDDFYKVGGTVEITSEEPKYAESFKGWTSDPAVTFDDESSASTSFEMPKSPVTVKASWNMRQHIVSTDWTFDETGHWHECSGCDVKVDFESHTFEDGKCSVCKYPDPDYVPTDDTTVTTDPGSTAGGAVAAVVVGGAAILGGYEIATRVILHNILPEGAAIPANRGQLALLIWNNAGKPEPVNTPAFTDISDADMAKAAQWCVEQSVMEAKTEDTFKPEGWTPKFKVIETWNKAFPKQ